MIKMLLATVVLLDLGSGWGSRQTDCSIDATWTADRESNYLYAVCDDGSPIPLPTTPVRETRIVIEEVLVTDGADPIERQNCSLVSDRTLGTEREITVICGIPLFANGYER